jgi:hypothetical protein
MYYVQKNLPFIVWKYYKRYNTDRAIATIYMTVSQQASLMKQDFSGISSFKT